MHEALPGSAPGGLPGALDTEQAREGAVRAADAPGAGAGPHILRPPCFNCLSQQSADCFRSGPHDLLKHFTGPAAA